MQRKLKQTHQKDGVPVFLCKSSLRWHYPNQVMGRNAASLLSACLCKLPVFYSFLRIAKLQSNKSNPGIAFLICQMDLISSRAIGNHGDRETNLLFYEFDVFSAVFRQIFVFLDTADIAFPSRQSLHAPALPFPAVLVVGKSVDFFAVDVVSYTYRNLIQIVQEHPVR